MGLWSQCEVNLLVEMSAKDVTEHLYTGFDLDNPCWMSGDGSTTINIRDTRMWDGVGKMPTDHWMFPTALQILWRDETGGSSIDSLKDSFYPWLQKIIVRYRDVVQVACLTITEDFAKDKFYWRYTREDMN